MPFQESFKESVDVKISKPRIWRFDIDKSNATNITSQPVENFTFVETISVDQYNTNYSKKNGIRDTIEKIRKMELSTSNRPFKTIERTKNNDVSSRSSYIQALKISPKKFNKSSYTIILDKPGQEDPYTTFEINEDFQKAEYSNPLYAVCRNFSKLYFNRYPLSGNKKVPVDFLNAFGFTNFRAKTAKEYLSKILSNKQTPLRSTKQRPNPHFMTGKWPSEQDREKYVENNFLQDLDDFATEHKDGISKAQLELQKMLKDETNENVFEYLKDIHNNIEWLNFEIKAENFNNFNDDEFTNMYINGFAKSSILIRDLFPIKEYTDIFENHRQRDSPFCNLFFNGNFFSKIFNPLLGWLLDEVFEMFGNNYSTDKSDNTIIKSKLQNKLLLTSNGVKIPLGNFDEVSFVDHTTASRFPLINEEYKLGFKYMMGLSKFGGQSLLNGWSSITSFLLMSALYFAIFKNKKNIDFYDNKVKMFLSFTSLDPVKAQRFYEAVSINELNSNQQKLTTLETETIKIEPITLNRMFFNSMYLMSDLILPNNKDTRYSRNERLSDSTVINMVKHQNMHLRIEVPFEILQKTVFDLNKRIVSSNPSIYYSMTQNFNDDLNWITVRENWENQSKPYYITDNTTFLNIIVINQWINATESGERGYHNILGT